MFSTGVNTVERDFSTNFSFMIDVTCKHYTRQRLFSSMITVIFFLAFRVRVKNFVMCRSGHKFVKKTKSFVSRSNLRGRPLGHLLNFILKRRVNVLFGALSDDGRLINGLSL